MGTVCTTQYHITTDRTWENVCMSWASLPGAHNYLRTLPNTRIDYKGFLQLLSSQLLSTLM